MVVNRRGIVFFYRLMLGITIIILGIALAFPTKDVIDEARDSALITCSTPASDFDQAACYALDIIKGLFVGLIIFVGVVVLTKLR